MYDTARSLQTGAIGGLFTKKCVDSWIGEILINDSSKVLYLMIKLVFLIYYDRITHGLQFDVWNSCDGAILMHFIFNYLSVNLVDQMSNIE